LGYDGGEVHRVELAAGRRAAITAGLLLGMSLGALEATVVGTAMPTVIAALGGLDHYSWVFSAYLLTSTASVPIWGRLSDLYGRRRLYLIGVALFLLGSVLAGAAQSMLQLVAFRAVQGLGAGALVPLAMTIIGEIYTVQERPRVQALFSGMWGLASIAGPLVGGWLTDAISWRWVFYINIPFGLLTAAVIGAAFPGQGRTRQVSVDWSGALLLFGGVSCLLAGLSGVTLAIVPWFAAAAALLALFAVVDRRAAEPFLPLRLFADPIVRSSLPIVFLLGVGMFGAVAFIPLFVQGAMGGTATDAGRVLTPLFLGWVITSIAGARLSLVVGYRRTTWLGIILMILAFLALAQLHPGTVRWHLLGVAFVLGAGMGFTMLALLLAIQHGVGRRDLGLATSLNQFSRSIGAAIGVALMGAVLSWRLGRHAEAAMQTGFSEAAARFDPLMADQLAAALRGVFAVGAGMAALAILPALLLPAVDFRAGVPARAGEELLADEMTTLEPEDEPSGVTG
jgi:EmrB/QacA subfamily drug resistance transporter